MEIHRLIKENFPKPLFQLCYI